MAHFGKITNKSGLRVDCVLTQYIQEAARLDASGLKRAVKAKPVQKEGPIIPKYFVIMLSKAKATFNALSYTNKRRIP
ncbi:MAG: hypothetical protein ACOYXT_17050 [Bacteroidota bacterium]